MTWKHEGSRHERGYGTAWDKLRQVILSRDNCLCQTCAEAGRITPAREVDHITPKAQGGTDDPDNLQSICSPCHKDKTQAERKAARGGKVQPRVQYDAEGRVIWE